MNTANTANTASAVSTTPSAERAAPQSGAVPSRISSLLRVPTLGPLGALLLACLYFSFASSRFLTGGNMSLILQQVMVVGTLAVGQSAIILTAGIGVCALFGAVNGSLVTLAKLPPFIVTLGTLNIAMALTHITSKEQTITGLPAILTKLGDTFPLGQTRVTYGSVLMLALFAAAWYVLRHTAAGRHLYAVGDNPDAVRLAGVDVRRQLITVYTIAGALYGIAALLLVARTGVGDPQAGQTENLDSITAVVLGGISLFGGRGSIVGALYGALLVGVIRNGLQLTGVDSVYQILITGILVILAVAVDQLARRRRK